MTASNYKPCLSLVLAHEGGFVNHPKDPGGATNQGVTQKVYDDYRRVNGLPIQSVKLITPLEVTEIYNKQYWKLVRGDSLPAGLDYAVFDFAVNSGVSRAVKYLQRLIGVNDVDGIVGNGTLAAVYDYMRVDEEKGIAAYCANRLAFLKSLGTFPTFGKGWTRRVIGNQIGFQVNDHGVIDYAISMARFDDVYAMPKAIGAYEGELAAKAYPVEAAKEFYPEATPTELEAVILANDALALKIALSQVD